MRREKILAIGCALAAGMFCGSLRAAPVRVWERDFYRAFVLKTPVAERDLAREKLGKDWNFADGGDGNFIWFSPTVADRAVSGGALHLKTSGESVTLGWGNYENRQPKERRIHFWPGWNEIQVRARQSAARSDWTLNVWWDGRKTRGDYDQLPAYITTSASAELKGTDWQTLKFRVFLPGADGFELVVKGPADNTVDIESVCILEQKWAGYFRKEFDLPRGRIWSAIAEVGEEMTLFVNGQEIDFKLKDIRRAGDYTVAVDLAPWLKAGTRNCVALAGERDTGNPFSYLQGRVVMSGGEVIPLDTGDTWRAGRQADRGWNRPGFDAAGWEPAQILVPSTTYAKSRWPAYDGMLVMENVYSDPQLYYDTDNPVRVRVRVPEGLAERKPVLSWVLRAVDRENAEPELARGKEERFVRDGRTGSLAYQVDAGVRPGGVYTLELRLFSGDQLLESRIREPLIVVSRISMKEVEGRTYEEGMDLELEQVIDFTDSRDPHPWVESQAHPYPYTEPAVGVSVPRITRKGDMVYRETTPGVNANFSYRFEFQKPETFYLMVLEYPNDADRIIGVSVTAATRAADPNARPIPGRIDYSGGYNSQAGPSVITGMKYPLTGKMQELKWVHYADREVHTLDIVSLLKDSRAAAARCWIYRIRELPALKVNSGGERLLGIHTERAHRIGVTFGTSDGVWPYEGHYDRLDYDMVARFTQRMRWSLESCENFTRYMKFTGQNLHVMGAYQYSEVNTSYVPRDRIASSRLTRDIRDIALRVFEKNGISMMSFVEYVEHVPQRNRYAASESQVAAGADTLSWVSREGKFGGWHSNLNHPAVEAAYLSVIDDLAYKFAHSPAWKGIYLAGWVDNGGWGPSPYAPATGPLDFCYSDATIAAFEKDTGIKVLVDRKDPKRFEKRYLFLTSDAYREKWIDWRCRRTAHYLKLTRDTLHRYRKDLQVMYGWHMNVAAVQNWLGSGKPYREYFRQFGMDPATVRQEKDIWFGRYMYPSLGTSPNVAVWEQHVGPEAIAYYDRDVNRFVAMNTCWHEIPTSVPGYFVGPGGADNIVPKDWPVPRNVGRFISQANADNARECFTQAMIGADPEVLIYGFTDVNIIVGHEQQVREFARVFLSLPKQKFQPVEDTTDFRHDLAIRELRERNRYWFYVANPGCWPVSAVVTLKGRQTVMDAATGRPADVREESGATAVSVSLPAYGIAAFRVDSAGSDARILSWKAAPSDRQALGHVERIVSETQRLMGTEAALSLSLQERQFVGQVLEDARASLEKGAYARAWSLVTGSKFWLLSRRISQDSLFKAQLTGIPAWNRSDVEKAPELKAVRAEKPPLLDGNLDDTVWQKAPMTEGFLSFSTSLTYLGIPSVDSVAQACYDDERIYLAFRLADPDTGALRAIATAADPSQVFFKYDDTMVMFFFPDGVVHQMAVNAGGVRYNARVAGTSLFRELDPGFREPWEAAVSRGKGFWTIEAAIPYATLKTTRPAAGSVWRVNFLRRFRNFLVPESYWSKVKSWYDTGSYGRLVFEK